MDDMGEVNGVNTPGLLTPRYCYRRSEPLIFLPGGARRYCADVNQLRRDHEGPPVAMLATTINSLLISSNHLRIEISGK